jgi:hypothetical protein
LQIFTEQAKRTHGRQVHWNEKKESEDWHDNKKTATIVENKTTQVKINHRQQPDLGDLMSQRFVVPKDQKQKKRRLIYLVRR